MYIVRRLSRSSQVRMSVGGYTPWSKLHAGPAERAAVIKLGTNVIGVCSAAFPSSSSSGGLQDGAVRRSNSFPSKGAAA